ncbi:MAG: UDP-glucose dehydrogenase family protein [Terriglobales bacterium]
MEISVIGAGYVGLTTAACLAHIGHDVVCADIDAARLELLRGGRMPFYEPHLGDVVAGAVAAGRLRFAAPAAAIARGAAFMICVGTPAMTNGGADLSAIESVAREIARHAQGYRLIVEKSTVPVQTGERLRRHLGIYGSSGLEYDVVSNPEFLREGSAVADFFHPDRIVVGAESDRARRLMEEIYRPVLERRFACPVHASCPPSAPAALMVTDTNSAELIKHASNSFLAMKISFINMISDLCEAAGADVDSVVEGLGADRRIGRAFLRPGIGFGGFCFPKDLQALVHIAESFGCDFSLLKQVEAINLARVERFVSKVRNELWTLGGKRIAVWGLAFKPETDDIRFAPAMAIVRQLLAEGAEIHAYDPQAMEKAKRELPEIHCHADAYQAAEDAEAALLLTEWGEFRRLDWARVAATMARPLVFDGRNALTAEDLPGHGIQYVPMGKAAEAAAGAPRLEAVQGQRGTAQACVSGGRSEAL